VVGLWLVQCGSVLRNLGGWETRFRALTNLLRLLVGSCFGDVPIGESIVNFSFASLQKFSALNLVLI
jgi:hypothetical protein